MKPFINLDELTDFTFSEKGKFKERYAQISDKIGAKKLSYSLSVVEPGHMVCPFHNHRIAEELFIIIEGQGTLRFGDKEYPVKKHDVIACPPGGRDVAHQIINTGKTDLRYFCLSTEESHEICEYPDSNKVMIYEGGKSPNKFRHMLRMTESLDYYDGELER